MTAPANPFAALHQPQTDGAAASSTGRGRGGPFRGSTAFQPRGGSAFQPRGGSTNAPRGRGRGRGTPATRAGRGNARGAGAGPGANTWRASKADQSSPATATSSPFAQLKNQPGVSGNAPAPQQKPTFSGFGQNAPGPSQSPSPSPFGSASFGNGAAAKTPPREPLASLSNGVSGTNGVAGRVPVEDASSMGKYNDRYEKLKIDRAKQRERAIKAGQMADPNQPMSLNKAITPVGTCTSMCPEFERVERIVQKMVDKSEKYLHPTTNTLQNMEAKMLKRFRRSAAGYDEQLPSDIRTPATLLQAMNYLTRHVIGGPEPLGIIHKFVWDRTRSIRNDFSVQQVTQEEDVSIAVTCLERIARFHIVSLHLLSSPANEEPFDRHQEREQLNNTMLSLMYYYDDNRGRISFPNEDEFRAYYIIFSIHDQRPDLEARVQKWPAQLRDAPRVRVALELFAAAGNTWEYQGTLDAKRQNAIAQGFYARFFSLVNSPSVSYLMACVAEIYFNHMRQTAIRSIWKGYCRYPASQQHKNEEWTVDELTNVLCFDDNDQTVQFCTDQDLEFAENANGDLYLNWGSRPVDSIAFQPSSDHSFSEHYVESKRAGRNLVAVVLGLNVQEAATLGMIDRSVLSERVSAPALQQQMSIDNDDSLFVSEDENETTTPTQPSETAPSMPSQPSIGFGATNGFGSISQQQQQPAQPTPASNPFNQPKAADSKPPASNPFSSLFPSAATNTSPAPSTSATASPSLNPFAKPFSPVPSSQPPVSFSPPVSSAQPSPFSNAGTPASEQPGQDDKGATPFKFPTTSQPMESPAPSSNIFANVQKPATETSASAPSPFQNIEKPAAQAPSSPFSNIQSPSNSNTSPFAGPQSLFSVKPDQSSGSTAEQPSTSIFAAPKPTPPAQTQPPLFSFSKPAEPTTQESQTNAFGIFKPQPPAEPATSSTPPSEDKNEPSSIFSIGQKPLQSESIFKAPASAPAEQSTGTPSSPLTNEETLKTLAPPASNDIVAQPTTAEPSLPNPELNAPAIIEPNDSQADTAVEVVNDGQANEAEEAKRTAWINSLREAADRRRNTISTPTNRKRVHEQETPPLDNAVKASKVSKSEAPPRKSMARSSMKPLPKLPILEQIESMTARKPAEQRQEAPKPNHVDEDDLLLSAARIAAESLRTGPRLVSGSSTSSTSAPYEPWRSYSPGSSIASSIGFSRSESPQMSHTGGFDVSYADTDLGLGRSLSRTEQRLRLTGGKGLAYKPLNITPKKSWRTPRK
ncbi:SAC3/GANP/Nin1/mts3/eIF-3 p25 family-domain-containing protein [Aspergillus unguis]